MNGHRPRNLTSTTLFTSAVVTSRRRNSLMRFAWPPSFPRQIPCHRRRATARRCGAANPHRCTGFSRRSDAPRTVHDLRPGQCRKPDKYSSHLRAKAGADGACQSPANPAGTETARAMRQRTATGYHSMNQPGAIACRLSPAPAAPPISRNRRLPPPKLSQAVDQADLAISITDAKANILLRQPGLRRA